MKSNTFWIVVALLVILALVCLFMSYWMVALGLAILVVALVVSRYMQTNNPKPTE